MPMNPRLLRPSSTFTPRSISGLALWLDAADSSTLFQDAAATIPATATNDPVGAWLDKSGNRRHMLQPSSSPRPVRSTQNNRPSLSFNGTSQWMRQERTNYRMRSHFLVWRRTATPPTFSSPFGANGSIAATLGGSAYAGDIHSLTFYSVPGTHYLSSSGGNFSATVARYQGAVVDVAALNLFTSGIRMAPDTAAVNLSYIVTGNMPAGNKAFFAGIEPFADNRHYPCQLLEAIQYGDVLTEAQSRQVERYLASKWGITLAPQVSNADAQDWINRVYANGGTVSAATANAVNQFCVDIENAGIRDRFYRLNLFCGNSDGNLNAVRTPLFRGPSLGGTQFGNATDTNFNFVAGDYAETGASGGLTGNGTSKLLDTGVNLLFSSPIDTHLAAYETLVGSGNDRAIIGADSLGATPRSIYALYQQSLTSTTYYDGNVAAFPVHSVSRTAGFWVGSNQTARRDIFLNGLSVAALVSAKTGVGTSATQTYRVFGMSQGAGVTGVSSSRLAGYSLGFGLTAAQALAYYNAMQTFQTALGRQV